MPIQKRHSTNYAGVHYIEGTSLDGKQSEKVFLIRYRKGGKAVEEKAGRQFKDNMTSAKASRMRALRIEGKSETNTEKRAKQKTEKEASINRPILNLLFTKYIEFKGDSLKGIRTDKSRFTNHLEGTLGKLTPQEIDSFTVNRLKKSIDQKHTS